MAKARSNNEALNWREFAALAAHEREEITRRVLELKLTKLDPDVCREAGILITLLSRILHANRCEQRGRRIHAELFGMPQHDRLTVALKEPIDATTHETFSGRAVPDLANYAPRRRAGPTAAPEVGIGQTPPERDVRDGDDADEAEALFGDQAEEDDSRLQRRHVPHGVGGERRTFERRHRPDFAVPPRGGEPAPRPRNNKDRLTPPPQDLEIGNPELVAGLRAMEGSLNRENSGSLVITWENGEIIGVNITLETAFA